MKNKFLLVRWALALWFPAIAVGEINDLSQIANTAQASPTWWVLSPISMIVWQRAHCAASMPSFVAESSACEMWALSTSLAIAPSAPIRTMTGGLRCRRCPGWWW